MLTMSDRLWLKARNAEFRLPASAIRVAAPLAGIGDPYLPQDNELRAIFIHIPKSAGTSLRAALYGCKTFHIPACRYKAFDEKKFQQYFKFSVVRNPWSRVVSAFSYLHKRRNSNDQSFLDHRWATSMLSGVEGFRDFVFRLEDKSYLRAVRQYTHFRDQIEWISIPKLPTGERELCVDYIGRFENIGADFSEISRRLGTDVELPTMRQGEMTDYRLQYTETMVDVIRNIYWRDINAFCYSFE